MTLVQKKLCNAYATLIMAGRRELTDVPETPVTLADGTQSTLRAEVEVEIAERTVQALG